MAASSSTPLLNLQELLQQDPGKVAALVVESAKQLEGGQPSGNAPPVADLLAQLQTMSPQQKGDFLQKTAQGLSKLPPKDQAQLISAGMKIYKASATEGGPREEHKQLLAQAHRAFQDVPERDMQAASAIGVQNLQEATRDPARLVMVAKELPPEERVELQQTLKETKMMPPESEVLLEHAMEPNGLLDKLGMVIEFTEKVKPYLTYIPIILLVEFGLGVIFHLFYCETPFGDWLVADAVAMAFLFGGLFLVYVNVNGLKTLVTEPPQELTQAAMSKDVFKAWRAIPHQQQLQVILVLVGLLLVIVGLLLQIPRALWGIVLFFSFSSCNLLVALISRIAILVKVVAVFGILGVCIYQGMQLWRKYGQDVGHVYGLVAGQQQGHRERGGVGP
mmetsp:Transcript_70618/g.169210  ORF Transcript_70618/g.169210 Transcript_70618/m.169210 type:complete len:391 (+) Transcript_70618:126-1298(+)